MYSRESAEREKKTMTVEEMIKKYRISLAYGKDGMIQILEAKRIKADKMLDEVLSHKPEIMAILNAEKEAKEKAIAERTAKINAIEGLKEINAAIEEHERFHYKFNAAMAKGDGRMPAYPNTDIKAMKAKYPRAAAYLKAEDFALSDHYTKSTIGKKALDRIINGENYEQVLADMGKEWSDYCNKHMWD